MCGDPWRGLPPGAAALSLLLSFSLPFSRWLLPSAQAQAPTAFRDFLPALISHNKALLMNRPERSSAAALPAILAPRTSASPTATATAKREPGKTATCALLCSVRNTGCHPETRATARPDAAAEAGPQTKI